jgi:hypothetical protein
MAIDDISRSNKLERIRLRPSPVANPGQVLRAILFGLLFAFLFVQALPETHMLFVS